MAEKKKNKKEAETELIRVEKPTLELVRKLVKDSRQSIGGFYTLAAIEKLEKEKK